MKSKRGHPSRTLSQIKKSSLQKSRIMWAEASFWMHILLFSPVSCADSGKLDLDCSYPQAFVSFRGYGTCLDKCPHINADNEPNSIYCYCSEDSNCNHLNALCNKNNQECECKPNFIFVRQNGTCLPIRVIGEDCEVDSQCEDLICNSFNGKCCDEGRSSTFIPTTEEDSSSTFSPSTDEDSTSTYIPPTTTANTTSTSTPDPGDNSTSTLIPTTEEEEDSSSTFSPPDSEDTSSIFISDTDGYLQVDTCFRRQELFASCFTDLECYQPNSVCRNSACNCSDTDIFLKVYDPQETIICGYEGRVFTITCTRQDFEKCTAGGIFSQCEYKVISGKQVLQRCVYPDSELIPIEGNKKSCVGEDQFGIWWRAENGFSDVKPCPFGNSSLNAFWSCKDGSFIGKAPNYDECRSEWLDSIEKNITDKPNIDFNDAIYQAAVILESVTSENSAYYGHEIKRIANLFDIIVTKLTPASTDCCNLTQILATQIVESITGLIKMELPWDQLQNNTEKHQTFSVVLGILSEQTLKTIQKGCLPNATNASSCEWSQKPFKFPQNNVEVGSFRSEAPSSGIFPSSGGNIAGRDTFIQFPHIENTSNYIGAILENRYAVLYTRIDTTNDKGIIVNGQDFNNDYEPNGDVVVFSVAQDSNKPSPKQVQLKEPVEITIHHSKYSFGSEVMVMHRDLHPGEQPSAVMGSAECGYWDMGNLNWSFVGCDVVSKSAYSTICSCNHLTPLSVLQQSHKYIGKSRALVFIVITLCCLIAFYLLFNIVAYLQPNPSKSKKGYPIVKFSGLLLTLFSYVVVIFFVDKHFFPYGEIGCYIIGTISHFIILMVTFVMILESFKQIAVIAFKYKLIDYVKWSKYPELKFIQNFSNDNPNMFSLGVPFFVTLIIVALTLLWDVWDGPNSRAYGGEFCWLDGGFIYALFIPMGISLAVNSVFLGIVRLKCGKMVEKKGSICESTTGEDINCIKSFLNEGLLTNAVVFTTWSIAFITIGPMSLGYGFTGYVFSFLLFIQGCLIDKLLDKEKYVKHWGAKIFKHTKGFFVRIFTNSDKILPELISHRRLHGSMAGEDLPGIKIQMKEENTAQPEIPTEYDPAGGEVEASERLDAANQGKLRPTNYRLAPRWGEDGGEPETHSSAERPLQSSDNPQERPPNVPRTTEGENKFTVFVTKDDKDPMNVFDLRTVENAVRTAIDKLDTGTYMKVGGLKIVRNVIEVDCHDEATQSWVKELGALQKEGGHFEASTEAPQKIPLIRIGVWIREKEKPSGDDLFSKLHRQNPNLDVSEWDLYHSMKADDGHYLTVGVPYQTLDRLVPPNKVYYYTDVLVFT